ncbi:Acyl-CoA dehydrogenase [Rhodococcus rhodochrous J3]|uniref:Alkylation response protein AidB-like acyl-CoA dehydrogenase n=3 Tax=Rhodococcus rhodochrous TaxID=1829 RepID=A0A562EPK3_RHORH|nr:MULTISPECIES: acyl-CoA dehydrogenase [Rhodococcus]MBF4476968.1 acyl-CoA dehydrogenase [Rhodococcus rhodochrous]MCB8908820.1 acyl-CoA dehydrogenase [Rhodococcus rhodochrous]MDC3727920.1 acyl-CoA dehydrogenase [Rhodococcus sp. Rp3]MDO1482437.1 acyl-CoA dehydrogenase [Rhodococcus rhodochrous]TWH23574.1 alkylation response protein AidB-like acyl-CoA dehydrogenase [Rhodococcus rhodochrous J45]
MLLDPSPDQEFFRDTTARFLAERVPPDGIRRLRDDPDGFAADYWRAGAELGWTGLLVDEDHGGGSLSGLGLVDLTLVAHEFGRHAAPGPLCPTNIAAEMLGRYGKDHEETLAALLAGRATAAWCLDEPRAGSRTATAPVEIRIDGDEVVVTGTKRPVEAVITADLLLVTGRTGQDVTNVLVPRDAQGVNITPLRSIDVTRRYAAVHFDEVRVPLSSVVGGPGGGADDAARARRTAIVISCAESVGALQAVFDLTVAWAFDRYSFGRPLASYQELKHRFADMKTWIEASHAIADRAAGAVATSSSDADELVCAAKAYIGQYGSELVQDCIQIHGGIGVTYEHDLHLYARRAAANRSGFGTPAEHRARLADIVELREAS